MAKLKAKVKKAAVRAKSAAKKVAKKATARKATAKKPSRKVDPIPKGYHMLTPSLVVRGAKDAIEFYKKAFGAKVVGSAMTTPSGEVMHAELQIGDSRMMIADEMPFMGVKAPGTLGGSSASVMIYTKDVDGLFNRAVGAGAKVTMPVNDAFWGDRYGQVEDPFGHHWQMATHKEDVPPRELAKRAAAAMMGAPPTESATSGAV